MGLDRNSFVFPPTSCAHSLPLPRPSFPLTPPTSCTTPFFSPPILNTPQVDEAVGEVDAILQTLFVGLAERNISNCVNVMIVSDHGMSTSDVSTDVHV